MKISLSILAALTFVAACKPRGPAVFRGVPEGVAISCGALNERGTVHACVGGGAAYTCVSDLDQTHYECALSSALPSAERVERKAE